jgi:antitoxin VapB
VRTARLFRNGQSQAVRLPKEFKFGGDKVFIKKVGDGVMLIPYQESWQSLFDSLEQFSDDFMTERGQPDQQVRESVFG